MPEWTGTTSITGGPALKGGTQTVDTAAPALDSRPIERWKVRSGRGELAANLASRRDGVPHGVAVAAGIALCPS